jgi:phosphoserine phosphatase
MADALDQILTLVLHKKDSQQLLAIAEAFELANLTLLSEGKAIEGTAPRKLMAKDVQAALMAQNIEADYCLQPAENRKKKLLICDMDSTLIGQECIDELADFAGFKDKVSAITERAMRGEIGFDGALNDRVALLKGLPLSELQRCFDERIIVNKGAKTLCATMKDKGAETVIVSGGFTFFSERVAEAIGFKNHHANVLLDDGSALTGTVQKPILGREAKLERLYEYSEIFGGAHTAVAIGDGANDLAIITTSGLGIAYYAKPAVAAAAHCAINYTDLRTALYFQGYKESEFIEAG